MITASGNYNTITAGSGIELIMTSGHYDTINLTAGTDTFTESGGSNTLVLPSASALPVQVKGDPIVLNDVFDLRTALAGTKPHGHSADLANYLGLTKVGGAPAIWIDADGTGPAASHTIAVLNNSSTYLTYAGLLAHSVGVDETPRVHAVNRSRSDHHQADFGFSAPNRLDRSLHDRSRQLFSATCRLNSSAPAWCRWCVSPNSQLSISGNKGPLIRMSG